MERKTHLAAGFLISLILYKYLSNNLVIPIILVASVFPDIDWFLDKVVFKDKSIVKTIWVKIFKRGMHRTILHNLWVLIIISFIMIYYLGLSILLTLVFSIGFLSHLILDSLTVSGIYWLWP